MPKRTTPYEARFWAKVEKNGPTDCWLWIASKSRDGYGMFEMRGAHRVAYEMLVGPIPDGLQVDHLCRTRDCVNPSHMELVTSRENTRRGHGPTARHAAQTHCVNGHEFTAENTHIRIRDGIRCRVCRACKRAEGMRTRERRRAEAR